MRYFHGTSYENGISIIKNGFSDIKDTVWTCSDPDMTYLASEEYGLYNENSTEIETEYLPAFAMALEEGQVAAATMNSKNTDIIVFEINIDADYECELEEDDSCENMSDCYQIKSFLLNQMIKENKIKMKVHFLKEAYIPYLRVFYLCELPKRYWQSEDKMLNYAINTIKNTGSLCTEIIGMYKEIHSMSYQEACMLYKDNDLKLFAA